jgi:hypothetical protein
VTGFSMAVTQTTPPITSHRSILGTLQYMSPEQLEGHEADTRTDIFAFGAIVYEMLTGKKAFEGKSQATLIAAIVSSEPVTIRCESAARAAIARSPGEKVSGERSCRTMADRARFTRRAAVGGRPERWPRHRAGVGDRSASPVAVGSGSRCLGDCGCLLRLWLVARIEAGRSPIDEVPR